MVKAKGSKKLDATTTTPSKTVNGKVNKVRVKIKNSKTQINQKENYSLPKSKDSEDVTNLNEVGLTSPCFVKLRRAHIKYSLCSQNNNNTLQDQCKVIDKASNSKKIADTILNIDEKLIIEEKLIKPVESENNVRQNEVKNNKLRTRKFTIVLPSKNNVKIVGDKTTTNKKPKRYCDHNKKTTESSIPIHTRKCVVRLERVQKILDNDEKLIIEEKLIKPVESENNVRQKEVKNKKLRTRKFTIVLPPKNNVTIVGDKIATNKKPKRYCDDNKTKTTESSIPIHTRKCVVRLRRVQKILDNDELAKTTIDAVDLNPNENPTIVPVIDKENPTIVPVIDKENPTIVPVIDKEKRNNFRKLSLTAYKNGKVNNTSKSEKNISEKENRSVTTSHKTKHNITEKCTESETSKITPIHSKIANTVQYNYLTKIQHLKEMSLNRNIPPENHRLDITQFEPQQNSTICFAPVRNSTLLAYDCTNDKNKKTIITAENKIEQEMDKEKEKEVEKSNSNSSSRNYANKTDEIEALLNSLDDDNVDADTEHNANNKKNNVQDNITKITPICNKTNRFFHRQDKNLVKEVGGIEQKKSTSKKKTSTLKSRRVIKRSSLVKRENIYEFLSQSQTSDSDSNKHLDPTADIIKRLIAQGKVRVATNCKGKGRPCLKREAHKRKVAKKVKQTVAKKGKKEIPKIIEVDENSDLEDHFMDNFDHDEIIPEVNNNNMEEQHQDPLVKRFDKHPQHPQHHISDQEGTFSSLARSVLINQAGRSNLQRQKAQRLLEVAQKFVSTPKNKKMSLVHEALHSNLSPIAMPSPRPAGNASPWRVDEDAHFPKVFNFNRSSGNLPSFSSDFIPFTPQKETPKNKTKAKSHLPVTENQSSIPSITPLPSNENYIADETPQGTNEQSVLSSFSSNDSNGENMPPPKAAHVNPNSNDNIFDLKQYPNPKRTLNYRSPLKAINILEVIHLTPYKHPSKPPHANDQENNNETNFGFEEDLNDDSLEIERSSNGLTPQENHCKKSKKIPSEDLFGFEDFLTLTDFSSQELCDDAETTNNNNKTIHDKLQDLRKLRPEENELQLTLLKAKTRNPLKTMTLFEDGAQNDAIDVNGMRQRGIKEMLCSTMIQSPQASTSKVALEQLRRRNVRDMQKPNFIQDANISELFKDPDPEVTFNENDAHRTYIRPYKRKRRLNEKNIIMFLESDESGDEDSAGHKKHHNSHETDTSSEKTPKKKRQRKEAKEKPEMTEFIREFKEMCKEVDSYKLIVEKSG